MKRNEEQGKVRKSQLGEVINNGRVVQAGRSSKVRQDFEGKNAREGKEGQVKRSLCQEYNLFRLFTEGARRGYEGKRRAGTGR